MPFHNYYYQAPTVSFQNPDFQSFLLSQKQQQQPQEAQTSPKVTADSSSHHNNNSKNLETNNKREKALAKEEQEEDSIAEVVVVVQDAHFQSLWKQLPEALMIHCFLFLNENCALNHVSLTSHHMHQLCVNMFRSNCRVIVFELFDIEREYQHDDDDDHSSKDERVVQSEYSRMTCFVQFLKRYQVKSAQIQSHLRSSLKKSTTLNHSGGIGGTTTQSNYSSSRRVIAKNQQSLGYQCVKWLMQNHVILNDLSVIEVDDDGGSSFHHHSHHHQALVMNSEKMNAVKAKTTTTATAVAAVASAIHRNLSVPSLGSRNRSLSTVTMMKNRVLPQSNSSSIDNSASDTTTTTTADEQQQNDNNTDNRVSSMEHLELSKHFVQLAPWILNDSGALRKLKSLTLYNDWNVELDFMLCNASLLHLETLELYGCSSKNILTLLSACTEQLQTLVVQLSNSPSESRLAHQVHALAEETTDMSNVHHLQFPKLKSLDLEASVLPLFFRGIVHSVLVSSECKTMDHLLIKGKLPMRKNGNSNVQSWRETMSILQSCHVELALPCELFHFLTESCRRQIAKLTIFGGVLDKETQELLMQCSCLSSLSVISESTVTSKSLIGSLVDHLPKLTDLSMPFTEFRIKQYMSEVQDDTPKSQLKKLDINLNAFSDFSMERFMNRIGHSLRELYCSTFALRFDRFCELTPLLTKYASNIQHLSLSVQALTVAGISRYKCNQIATESLRSVDLKLDIHLSFEEMSLVALCLLHKLPNTCKYTTSFDGSISSNPQFPNTGLEEDLGRDVLYKLPRIVDQVVGFSTEEKETLRSGFERGVRVPPIQRMIDQLCELRREEDKLNETMRFRESTMHNSAFYF